MLQELRAKVTAAQTSQAEMLQRAGEICAEAEERARGADRRADRAEERASRAEADLKVPVMLPVLLPPLTSTYYTVNIAQV